MVDEVEESRHRTGQSIQAWEKLRNRLLMGDALPQGFYDPIADKLIEPELAGISYSFTADGFYEEAYYRAVPNRTFTRSSHTLLTDGMDQINPQH